MSSAACVVWRGSGASGIDASVSLPLWRERGAMLAAVRAVKPRAAVRDSDALVHISDFARRAEASLLFGEIWVMIVGLVAAIRDGDKEGLVEGG